MYLFVLRCLVVKKSLCTYYLIHMHSIGDEDGISFKASCARNPLYICNNHCSMAALLIAGLAEAGVELRQ
ncbi:hypothetical protein T4D_2354 [Trichinella pseudospiralis]|uniref:Uncharacterized protein n=1 Tax=Trichinella pseudospiralis TaxID=6337 RepID=A0A0V1FJ40_TRIPS|nr:hypothetical protein T4D_2354 [Trichinella pseudospiralis]